MSQIANNFSTEVFSVASASFYSEDDSLKGIKKKKKVQHNSLPMPEKD